MLATPITIAYGDGIGPEIMEAALHVLREAEAPVEIETIEIGARIYSMGATNGILPSAWETLRRTKLLLKAPVIVPAESEDLSLAIRREFGLADAIIADEVSYAISEQFAMFEPSHTALPEMKGKNRANPSSMLLAAMRMLEHIGQMDTAERIYDAWRKTLEDGIHTRDLYQKGISQEKAGTREFAEAVAERLGQKPSDKTALAYGLAGV